MFLASPMTGGLKIFAPSKCYYNLNTHFEEKTIWSWVVLLNDCHLTKMFSQIHLGPQITINIKAQIFPERNADELPASEDLWAHFRRFDLLKPNFIFIMFLIFFIHLKIHHDYLLIWLSLIIVIRFSRILFTSLRSTLLYGKIRGSITTWYSHNWYCTEIGEESNHRMSTTTKLFLLRKFRQLVWNIQDTVTSPLNLVSLMNLLITNVHNRNKLNVRSKCGRNKTNPFEPWEWVKQQEFNYRVFRSLQPHWDS